MALESANPWVLVSGGHVKDYFPSHEAAIKEASVCVKLRDILNLPPRTYGVYKRRDI